LPAAFFQKEESHAAHAFLFIRMGTLKTVRYSAGTAYLPLHRLVCPMPYPALPVKAAAAEGGASGSLDRQSGDMALFCDQEM